MDMTPSQEIVQKASEASGIHGAEIPDIIYHYTSIEALKGILFGNPNPDTITFFLTHFQHMNDETEVLHGLSAINQILCRLMSEYNDSYSTKEGTAFKEIGVVDLFDKLLNHFMVRFADEDVSKSFLDDYIKRNPNKKVGQQQITEAFYKYRSSVFIGSFSRLNDNKRMWRDYAGGEKGVCLALDTKKILDTFPFKALQLVNSVNYMEKSNLNAAIEYFFREIIDAIAKHKTISGNLEVLIAKKPDIANDLFTLVTLRLVEFISKTKNPLWSHEDEIRIFLPHLKTERVKEIEYRISKNNRPIPYIPLSFPKNILLDVIPGRKSSENTRKAINLMRRTKGLGTL
jgi:hypothetical protein